MNHKSHPLTRLQALGLHLPKPPAAVGAYLPWQRMGNIITTSFQLPWVDGKLAHVGRLGEQLTTAQGREAAHICALNGLAQLESVIGDLGRIRIVRIEGHVGCVEGFAEIPQVLNAGSELINEVMGEQGQHARTALGHQVMPLAVPVMLGFWAELLNKSD